MATAEQARASMSRILKMCAETMTKKQKEYVGTNKDVLLNFKAGQLLTEDRIDVLQEPPYRTLWGYMLKHLVSIGQMCTMVAEKPSRKQWDEKIGDTINYLLLLSAMIDEDIASERWEREGSKKSLAKTAEELSTPAKDSPVCRTSCKRNRERLEARQESIAEKFSRMHLGGPDE